MIDSLNIHNTHSAGIQIDSSHCTVSHCEIYNTGFGIAIHCGFNKIFHNNIHDLHIIRNTPGGNDDYGAVGIEVEHGKNEIAWNYFLNCIDQSYDYGVDGGALEFFGDIKGLKVHHNYAENCDGFFEAGAGVMENIEIYYNLLVNNGEIGGFHFQGDFAASVKNFLFINNSVFDLSKDQYEVLWFNGENSAGKVQVLNNIIVYQGFDRFSGNHSFQHDYNLYYSPSNDPLGISLNQHELQAIPGFIDPLGNNFQLNFSSPAINAGTSHDYEIDYLAHQITDSPDLGAFERQIISGQTDQSSQLKAYPNPSPNVYYLSECPGQEWVITNLQQQVIKTGSSRFIDLGLYQDGIYILKLGEQGLLLFKRSK